MNFKDKVVLVTGASVGIGEETALLFAKLGAKLALVARSEENLKRVAAECEKKHGSKPLIVVADLSTDDGVAKAAEETLKHYGRLDVLVNNAGVGARTTIEKTDMETFDRVFNLNVRGVYDLTRRLVPALVQAKGNIVNVSSIAGKMVSVGSLPYAMSKAALDHFTRLVALELAPKGVRVNAVSPGVTAALDHFTRLVALQLAPKGVRVNAVSPGVTVSEFVKRLTGYTDEQYTAWLKDAEKSIPMGRVAQGAHVAQAIAYLASDAADLITGAILPVDGGTQLSGVGNSDLLKKQVK